MVLKKYIEDRLENNNNDNRDPHAINKKLTKLIMEADKRYIPRGNIRKRRLPLPEDIRNKISERNDLRTANPDDPRIPDANERIQESIKEHKRTL